MPCAEFVHIGIMYLFQPSWPNYDESGFLIALHCIGIQPPKYHGIVKKANH